MSDRFSNGWGAGARTAWRLAICAAAGWMSACVADAKIPACIRNHSCGLGGSAGQAANGGASAGRDATGAGVGNLAGDAASSANSTEPAGDGAAAGEGAAGQGSVSGDAGSAGLGGGTSLPPVCEGCVIDPLALPEPCAAQPYRAEMSAKNGVPPYSWALTPAVEGWSIAAEPGQSSRAVLESPAVGAGETEITVQAIDSRGLAVSVDYVVHARDACWFAYTASGAGGAKLALLDARAERSEPAELEHNTAVYDFRFSPDGRYLAYRYGADTAFPQGRHLALVELSTLDERGLDFVEDAVTAYAWSPDSSVLAVGFSANEEQYLGGVRMPARGSNESPKVLSSRAAFVEDNLAWVQPDAVAYHAELYPDPGHPGQYFDNPDHFRTPFYARLGLASFDEPQLTIASFEPEMAIWPAPDGFWVLNWFSTFFPMSGSAGDSVPQWDLALLGPSGAFGATLLGGRLSVFKGFDSNLTPELATASSKLDEPCTMPLGWSSRDEIACVVDVDNGAGLGRHGELRLFHIEAGRDELAMSTVRGFCTDDIGLTDTQSCTGLRHGYGYGVAEAFQSPRAFSGSGNWFAFTRAIGPSAYVYWADVDAQPPTLSGKLFYPASGAVTHLAFSPDNRQLALQAGKSLFTKVLSGVSSDVLIASNLSADDACIEELPNASAHYCGDTSLRAPYKWAPDSKALAYRASGKVTVVDVSFAEPMLFPLTAALCEPPSCSGEFEFQPSIK